MQKTCHSFSKHSWGLIQVVAVWIKFVSTFFFFKLAKLFSDYIFWARVCGKVTSCISSRNYFPIAAGLPAFPFLSKSTTDVTDQVLNRGIRRSCSGFWMECPLCTKPKCVQCPSPPGLGLVQHPWAASASLCYGDMRLEKLQRVLSKPGETMK